MPHDLHRDGTAALLGSGALDGVEWTLAVRPRRRRLGLQVKPDGQLVVAVPPQASADSVVSFVTSNRDWIRRTVTAQHAENQAAPNNITLVDGQPLHLLGERYALDLTDAPGAGASWSAGRLTMPRRLVATRGARPIVESYITEGTCWAQKRAADWFDRLGLSGTAPRLGVRDLGTRRMGVYNPRYHRVELHWPLFQLGEDLAELVLVHELVHATRPAGTSHGPEWRSRMDRALPGWRYQQRRMRQLAQGLWTGQVSRPA